MWAVGVIQPQMQARSGRRQVPQVGRLEADCITDNGGLCVRTWLPPEPAFRRLDILEGLDVDLRRTEQKQRAFG